MKSNFERIGDHIRLVDERNRDESIKTLLGLTIEKVFIPSVANTIGSDMGNYKVIRRGQFACSLMQVRRDKRMPVALLAEIDEAIISQAYPVFEITDTESLLPDYLMMWFRRPEFDREACFHAVGGVRGSLEWEDFCNLRLPVPSPEKQREMVAEYETVVNRIALNEKLGRSLEETAQAIYKHWFVDFDFPMSAKDAQKLGKPELEGKPYKSSGGEMVFDKMLEKEIPSDWERHPLGELGTIKGGKRLPLGMELQGEPTLHPYIRVSDMGSLKFSALNHKFQYLSPATQKLISRYVVSENDVIISIVGTIGVVKVIDKSLGGANLTENCARIYGLKKIRTSYLFHYLSSEAGQHEIELRTVGGVQGKLPLYNIAGLQLIVPPTELAEKFERMTSSIDHNLRKSMKGSDLLAGLREMILSRVVLAK